MEMTEYKTFGTCSRMIYVDVDADNKITHCQFINGCPGNTLGISKLVIGMDADKVIETFEGNRCGFKPTSCPDQLAQALKKAKKERDEAHA